LSRFPSEEEVLLPREVVVSVVSVVVRCSFFCEQREQQKHQNARCEVLRHRGEFSLRLTLDVRRFLLRLASAVASGGFGGRFGASETSGREGDFSHRGNFGGGESGGEQVSDVERKEF
jgi:hypothetical protein